MLSARSIGSTTIPWSASVRPTAAVKYGHAGVTLRIGQGETRTYSSQDAVSQELNNLKSVVEQQNRKLEDQSNQIAAQNNKN